MWTTARWRRCCRACRAWRAWCAARTRPRPPVARHRCPLAPAGSDADVVARERSCSVSKPPPGPSLNQAVRRAHAQDLDHCWRLTDAGLAPLLGGLPALAALSLAGCFRIGGAALVAAARLPALRALDVAACDVNDAAVQARPMLHGCGGVAADVDTQGGGRAEAAASTSAWPRHAGPPHCPRALRPGRTCSHSAPVWAARAALSAQAAGDPGPAVEPGRGGA